LGLVGAESPLSGYILSLSRFVGELPFLISIPWQAVVTLRLAC